MTNTETHPLHPNGNIILTTPLLSDTTCSYSGNRIDEEYAVLIGVSYDTDQGIEEFVAHVSLHSVDALANDLVEFTADTTDDPAVFGQFHSIEYRDGINAACAVCLEAVTGRGIIFDAPNKKSSPTDAPSGAMQTTTTIQTPAIALHCDCTDECAAALKAVWEYTDDILSDTL